MRGVLLEKRFEWLSEGCQKDRKRGKSGITDSKFLLHYHHVVACRPDNKQICCRTGE